MPVFNASDQAVNIVSGTTVTAASAAAAAGSNRFLEVFLLVGAGSLAAHNGVTWGGEALTQRGSSLDVGSNWRMSRWFLKEADFPSGATGDIVGTFASAQDEKVLLWMVHEDVDQTNPYRNASQTTATGTDNSPTVTVTSDTNDVVTACAWAGRNSAVITGIAVNAGVSREEVDAVAGGFECAGMGTIAGASPNVAQSWTVTTGDTIDWGMLGDSLQDAVAASAAVTGTATASIDEGDIVAGGKTVIVTLTGDTFVSGSVVTPTLGTDEGTESGNNTASGSWAVAHPDVATGDLVILCISWDDSTATTDVTEPAGPNSEVLSEVNATPAVSSNTACRCKVWYTIATAPWTAGTLTFTPSANEQWTAAVAVIPAGEFDATTPIGANTTHASAGVTETAVLSAAFSAGSTDGDGRLFCWTAVNQDPQSLAADWTQVANQDRGIVSGGLYSRDAAVSDSESIAEDTVATIAGDDWCSVSFIVRAPTASPFEAARQAMIDGMDSAQSEANGWDAEVKANQGVSGVVRTSDTVVTITLDAQAAYDITAQETITVTVPGAILTSGSPIVATPTFTVSADVGAQPDRRVPPRVVGQAVNRSYTY